MESIEAAKISLTVTVEKIEATSRDRCVVIGLARASGQEALSRRRTVVLCSLRERLDHWIVADDQRCCNRAQIAAGIWKLIQSLSRKRKWCVLQSVSEVKRKRQIEH